MKMWKKLLTSVLSAAMVFTLLTGSVCAAETTSSPYTYTVTFYPGNHGTFNESATPSVTTSGTVTISKSADKIVVSGLNQGDKVGLNTQSALTLTDNSKYYAKGIRLSGRDNGTVADSVFTVNGDADYVAAYGIKGDQVKYTVKYVHEDGAKIAAEEVFYGNVGDKPVVAYKYISGYAPKALGLTKTLKANEAENVFEFVYVDAPSPSVEEIVTEDVTYNETLVTINGGTTVVGGTGGASNVTGGGAGDDAEATEGTAGETADEEVEIVDLDDEETPLGNVELEGEAIEQGLPMALYLGMGSLALVAIIVAVYVYQKFKKKEEA